MNNLKHLRQEKGLSIPELHRITGYPIRTLEDWDSNKRQITSYHRIRRLSALLECNMDDLMTWSKKCLYGDDRVLVEMFQEEEGVHVVISKSDCFEDSFGHKLYFEFFRRIITREKALELIKYLKTHWDIRMFFAEEGQK